jgi:hypothetical protein
MLQSFKTKGYLCKFSFLFKFLAVDIFDKVQGCNDSFYPSTKSNNLPHIRSAFFVAPYE